MDADQVMAGFVQVLVDRIDSGVEITVCNHVVKMPMLRFVLRDPFGDQDELFHCGPLGMAAGFIDQLVKPYDESVSRAFSEREVKLGISSGESLRIARG